MLTIGTSSRTAVRFIIFFDLLLLSSFYAVQALPAHRHAPSLHLSRRIRLPQPRRAAAAQSSAALEPEYSSSQHYLHRRRQRAARVSSSPRSVVPSAPHAHELDVRHLPAQLTTVRHVVLSRRRHHYDDDGEEEEHDAEDDDDAGIDDDESEGSKGSKKGKAKQKGKDANGYDDGSWRGDKGDYGGDGSGSGSWGDKKGKVKSVKSSAEKDTNGDDKEEDAVEEDDDQGTFTPKAKVKAVKGTKAGSESVDEGEDPDAEEDATATTDDEDNTATPTSEVKAVNSSKKGDDKPTSSSDDDEPTTTASSTKKTRSSATPARPSSSSSSTSGADCDALAAVYEDMGGADWLMQDGWGAKSSSCCSAYGVSCDSKGKVTALDLEGNGLSGTLSPRLFDLSALYRLNISSNAISGTLPDQFDALPDLTSLYLDQNALTGTIPPTLQNSTSLGSLHISNNTLDGMLYFPKAYNLTQLYASRNAFTYLNIEANNALVKVTLDDNQFNCTLPDVSTFTELQTFSAARNQFSGEIFDVAGLTQLTKLDLQRNLLTGSFPDVTKLSSLSYLALNGNDLSGRFPSGSAPTNLTTCRVDPVLTSSCPSSSVMNDPASLASQCQLQCRGGGRPVNAAAGTDDAAANDAEDAAPRKKAKTKSAAGQEGSKVEGDDSGQTPASLAAAYAMSSGSRSLASCGSTALVAMSALLSLWAML